MKILLVNTSERTGGAAIASLRLMHALNNNGVQAKMLVRDKQTENPDVLRLPTHRILTRAKFCAERAEIFASNMLRRENLWAVDIATHGTDITLLPAFQEADIIHLNWINQGMLSLSGIRRIVESGKPIVWTLHDMWPCTGICHHAENCRGWLSSCGNCPKLARPGDNDLSARTFNRKQQAYKDGGICFVACSHWLADIARRAPLLQSHRVESIPNAIDTQFYQPGNKAEARKRLGLPTDKHLMLFVAYKATDEQKGINYLIEATRLMAEKRPEWIKKLGVVPVGKEASTLKDAFACPTYPIDYVTSPEKMRDLYRAADLLVMPTLMDNLPNTIVEAMCCALPCVAFNIGGLPQMVQNGLNGFLARYRDAEDFARLSLETLFSSNYRHLAEGAHRTAQASYSEEVVAAQYIKLYESLLK
ncbi:MAG: glycosyltransferase family 4 protein [Alloprevotella sp.]|nr:glycosyltransferase family 4 protein [Alloprevotella sp.]